MNLEIIQKMDALRCAFSEVSVAMPLVASREDIGVIVDATGRDVLTVDSNGERDDGEVIAIAKLIVAVLNTHCGYLPGVDYTKPRREKA